MFFSNEGDVVMGTYHLWDIAEEQATQGDDKREAFLNMMLGEVRRSDRDARKSTYRLPLYRIPSIDMLVAAKGFGAAEAKKLRGNSTPPHAFVTGMCLWDNRWKAHIAEDGAYGLVAVEQRKSFTRDVVGRESEVVVELPTDIDLYHDRLLALQSRVICNAREEVGELPIYYHLPHTEYQMYIDQMPVPDRKKKVMGQRLREFTDMLIEQIHNTLGAVSFIDPISDDPAGVARIEAALQCEKEVASFIYPYARFGDGALAVEDLAEFSLPSRAKQARNVFGTRLHCRAVFGILAEPAPYLHPVRTEDTIMV